MRQIYDAARERLGWREPGLYDALQRAERAAADLSLRDDDALQVVDSLEHYTGLLQLARAGLPGENFMAEQVARLATHVRGEMARVIVGQAEPVDQLLLVLLCGGHALIEGVPGLAKTLAVKTLARIGRPGFSSRAMHSRPDARGRAGHERLQPAGRDFCVCTAGRFLRTCCWWTKSIARRRARNRRCWKSMEERQATIDGKTHPLSNFFTVFATQNPIEFEGTYPLPEAQLDRFLVKIRVVYPKRRRGSHDPASIIRRDSTRTSSIGWRSTPLPEAWLAGARAEVAAVRVEPALLRYVTSIVRRSREWPALSLGASPRAAVNLFIAAKATAALDGRDFLIPDDVKSVAPSVLRHRFLLKPEADLEGVSADQIVTELLASVEVPK